MAVVDVFKFLGYFLLVMALIYGALLLTVWIGKKTAEKTRNKDEKKVEIEEE